MRIVLVAAAAMLLAGAAPPGATNCSGCHMDGVLPINARSATDLSATMLAFRNGDCPSTLMGRLMKGLTPEQIADIAAWVSAQR